MTTTVACTNINLLTESQMPASPSNTELYAVELSGQPMDTNASNATSTGKSTIVGWGMPDYSAAIAVNAQTYTATANGYVEIKVNANASVVSMSCGGVEVCYGGGGATTHNNSVVAPIAAGQTFTGSDSSESLILRFFPCKGG